MQNYQGDISIVKANNAIKELASKKTFIPLKENLTIAEGEVTGHKHILVAEPKSQIEIAKDEFGYFVKINQGQAVLTHEQHQPQTIEKGLYWFGTQWEYDELKERKVQD